MPHRAPSPLFEVMEEQQVTVDVSVVFPALVIATQNPIE